MLLFCQLILIYIYYENSMSDTTFEQDQDRELEIALYYTDHELDDARAMVAGDYKDQYALKGVFSSSTKSGAFLIFFSLFHQAYTHISVVIAPNISLDNLDPSSHWIVFEKRVMDIVNSGKTDPLTSANALNTLTVGMSFEFCRDIKKFLSSSDVTMINYRFKKLIEGKLEANQAQLSIDIEPVSSLDIELYSISTKKLDWDELKKRRLAGEDKLRDLIGSNKIDNPLEGQDVQVLLSGNLVLSPIKGKKVMDLAEGDRVKVNLFAENPKAIKIARAFKAYNEGTKVISPIRGRVVVNRLFKKEHEVYVAIAKGIYVKTSEAEPVKVEVEEHGSDKKKAVNLDFIEFDEKNNPMVIFICSALFLLIIIILAYFW